MVRHYRDKKDAEFFKRRDKYEASLTRLRAMQDEAERPENRYYCRCHSVADTDFDEFDHEFEDMITQIHKKICPYKEGEVVPIDPETVTGMELIYRTLLNTDEDQIVDSLGSQNGEQPSVPEDGYRRWEPGRKPRNIGDYQILQERLSYEIRRLQSRKDRGYNMSAPFCDGCPAGNGADVDDILEHWVQYADQFFDTINAYAKGEIEWPKNTPGLFQIKARDVS